jgi:hypothetical protein
VAHATRASGDVAPNFLDASRAALMATLASARAACNCVVVDEGVRTKGATPIKAEAVETTEARAINEIFMVGVGLGDLSLGVYRNCFRQNSGMRAVC